MEFTGKTVEEAIKIGLEIMSLEESQAEITIKQQPVKGLFGRIKSEAVVEIQKKEQITKEAEDKEQTALPKESLESAKTFLSGVLEKLGLTAEIIIGNDGENDVLTLTAEDSSSLIGYRGEVLDALQTLVSAIANIGNKTYKKVVVDCESYRERREETLISLAKKLEAKATEMRREVILEPMSPFERRIIHTALADSQTVTTTSQGVEPNRHVVIVPNDKDEYAKPYNAGRNNNKSSKRNDRNHKNSGHNKGGKKPYAKKSSASTTKSSKSFSSFGTYLGNRFKDEN